MSTVCTIAFIASTAWFVIRKVEEFRSRYGAKLQHAFLTFSSGVFLQHIQSYPYD